LSGGKLKSPTRIALGLRRGVEGPAFGRRVPGLHRALARLVVQVAQALRLGAPLHVGVVLEVRRRHAQRAHRRLQRRLHRDARHRLLAGIGGPGQRVAAHRENP
jgi:hypothetical protein